MNPLSKLVVRFDKDAILDYNIFTVLNVWNMKNKVRGYKPQADLIRAMAHPTRLRILEILSHVGECCVCHLTAILEQRQPYVSQQLMVLRDQRLVKGRRDAVMVYYRLTDDRISDFISLTRGLLEASGAEARLPVVPESPVQGCTCPECVAQSP